MVTPTTDPTLTHYSQITANRVTYVHVRAPMTTSDPATTGRSTPTSSVAACVYRGVDSCWKRTPISSAVSISSERACSARRTRRSAGRTSYGEARCDITKHMPAKTCCAPKIPKQEVAHHKYPGPSLESDLPRTPLFVQEYGTASVL